MRERGSATHVAVTVIGIAIVAFLALFLWRTGVYYFAIRSGDTSKLPQFSSSLSFDPANVETSSAKAERALLETSDDPSFGAEDAPLVIVEFVDYECPFCHEASDIVRTVASRYADRVKVIVRDFPVNELHPDALLAAEALGCAEEQDVFWSMHDRALSTDEALTRAVLDRIAEQSGAGTDAFAACMSSHRRLKEVEDDIAAGIASGVRGTPTFFFNGSRVEGAIPEDTFENIIKAYLGE